MFLACRNTAPKLLARSNFGPNFSRANRRTFFSSSSANHSDKIVDPFSKYNLAVSYIAKQRDSSFDSQKNPVGEDNYVIAKNLEQGKVLLGVADGVGGWSEVKNCSSADMSRELCLSAKEFFENNKETNSTRNLLHLAYNDISTSGKVKVGGTTICMGIVDIKKQEVEVLNLGDSWFGLFRDFKCINETKFQTHGFNTPYQLSVIPDEMQKAAQKKGMRYILDTPDSADTYKFKIQKNDVLVFATDGVTDNVLPEDIEIFLRDKHDSEPERKIDLQEAGDDFVTKVSVLGMDSSYPSPFSQELSKMTGQRYSGGKTDDVTVVMMKVM